MDHPEPRDTPENPRSYDGRPGTNDAAIRRFGALGVLAHELAGLLDGSTRYLAMARAVIDRSPSHDQHAAQDELAIVAGALDRMAELVRGAMESPTAGTLAVGLGCRVSLAEAIHHAARVVDAWSRQHQVEVRVSLEPGLESVPAGPLYVVVLNAIRNAAEAIVEQSAPGVVRVTASISSNPQRMLRLVIEDDGPGLPAHLPADALFAHGISAKESGAGLGLSIARHLVAQLGGTIRLTPGRGGLGAILSVRCPVPVATSDIIIGRDDAGAAS